MKEKPNNKNQNKVLPKTTIDDLDLFDVPMIGIFKNKDYAAYTLLTLAGIKVKDLDTMEVKVEDFLENTKKGKRNMRMDARINISNGKLRSNIEIQRLKKGDETARVLNYVGGLATDFPKGLKIIPDTENIVILICNFDPFADTPYEGQTRMRFTLTSNDDEKRFHTLTGRPYLFEGITIIIYNGAQDWEKNPPRSEEEEQIRIYLEDMKKANPEEMTSEIAKNACKEYKEDPVIMSKTKDWIRYNFQEEFKELEDNYEKKIKKIEEEKEKQLLEQKIQIAERLLEAGTMSIEEIAKYTDLEEFEVKKLAMKKDS